MVIGTGFHALNIQNCDSMSDSLDFDPEMDQNYPKANIAIIAIKRFSLLYNLKGKVAITKTGISKMFLCNQYRVIPSLKIIFKNADRQSSNSYSHLKVQSRSIAMHSNQRTANSIQSIGFQMEKIVSHKLIICSIFSKIVKKG